MVLTRTNIRVFKLIAQFIETIENLFAKICLNIFVNLSHHQISSLRKNMLFNKILNINEISTKYQRNINEISTKYQRNINEISTKSILQN
jgi:hypothetical protein